MSEKKCACFYREARECYRSRYAPVDDFSRSQFFEEMDCMDMKCECVCHDPDEWDEYEEDGPLDLEDQLENALDRSALGKNAVHTNEETK